MALSEGRDYLFFEKVDCSKQSLMEALTRGAAVMTPGHIFMIPDKGVGSFAVVQVGTTHSVGGQSPVAFVRGLLSDPTMDVPRLEEALKTAFGEGKTRWVFPVRELEKLKMTTGFLFGQTTLKMKGESVRRMVIRDKGGKAKAKAFYAGALAS